MRLLALTGIVVFMSASAFAQDAGTVREKQRQDEVVATLKKQLAEGQTRVPIESPIKGAPYSADVIVESNQTLADGNHISHKDVGHVYRDSDGRTRREENAGASILVNNERASFKTTWTSIVDPVAGYSYSLDAEHKIAWRTPIATGAALQGDLVLLKRQAEQEKIAAMNAMKAQADARARGELQKEVIADGVVERTRGSERADASLGPLEHKTIDGISVEGRVNTKVIPAGAIGNDLPITITSEEWTSPDLQVLVMTRHSDPRSGDSTYRLANIVRADPDPSLFMVPPDYTVKDTGIRRNTQNW
ncbi:MAG: hypothetical protein ACRD1V_05745 [Vicinamibacterales bacterium]